REVRNVVEQAIDRKVAPAGVLLRRAVRVVGGDEKIGGDFGPPRRLGSAAKRGDLDHFPAPKENVGEPETTPEQPAVPEEVSNRLRRGVGAHIEVLRNPAEQKVTDAASHQERPVSAVLESVENLQRVRVDRVPGDRMAASRPNDRKWLIHSGNRL